VNGPQITVTTCPPWCDDEDGHDAASLAEQDMRGHQRLLARVVCSESTPRSCAVEVYVTQLETLEEDGRLERHPPGVFLCGIVDVADDLSARESRRLAAALLDAADELDRMAAPW
jgi:hypothetical protein